MFFDFETDRSPLYLPIYRCPWCRSPLKGFNGDYITAFVCPNATTNFRCGTLGLPNFTVNFDIESRSLVSITFKTASYQLYVVYLDYGRTRQQFSELRTYKWVPLYSKSTTSINDLIFTTDFVDWNWHMLEELENEIKFHAAFT